MCSFGGMFLTGQYQSSLQKVSVVLPFLLCAIVACTPLPSCSRNLHGLNLKSEVVRRKTYETWCVPFMDADRLTAAGFYYYNWSDKIRCTFCGVQVGRSEEVDGAFKEHQRWSPTYGFIKGLFVGNIPIRYNDRPEISSSQHPSSSYDVCGAYIQYIPNLHPEIYKFIFTFICLFISM